MALGAKDNDRKWQNFPKKNISEFLPSTAKQEDIERTQNYHKIAAGNASNAASIQAFLGSGESIFNY